MTPRKESSSACGTRFWRSPPRTPRERKARDAAREIARRPDSAVRTAHIRRLHARMPLPSDSWVLQQSGSQAFRGLLHERGSSPNLWTTSRSTVRGDVGTPRLAREIHACRGWCGCWKTRFPHSRLQRFKAFRFLSSTALRVRRAFHCPPRTDCFAAEAARGDGTRHCFRRDPTPHFRWLSFLQ